MAIKKISKKYSRVYIILMFDKNNEEESEIFDWLCENKGKKSGYSPKIKSILKDYIIKERELNEQKKAAALKKPVKNKKNVASNKKSLKRKIKIKK